VIAIVDMISNIPKLTKLYLGNMGCLSLEPVLSSTIISNHLSLKELDITVPADAGSFVMAQSRFIKNHHGVGTAGLQSFDLDGINALQSNYVYLFY
jgi:hypothetical protein